MPEPVGSVAEQPALSPSHPDGTATQRQPDAAGTRGCPAPPSGAPAHAHAERVRAAADGLAPLVAQAEAVRAERARSQAWPRWTDVFTTQFTEFSNRPR